MKKIKLTLGLICFLSSQTIIAQDIIKLISSDISGTICPVQGTPYEVKNLGGLGGCEIVWSAINGQYAVDPNDQTKVTVNWSDTPGAKGKLTATFVNCTNSSLDNTSVSVEELILSVKNKAWGSYTNSVNLEYCTSSTVTLQVPRMFVQGTGGFTNIAQTEVSYYWDLPTGWIHASSGQNNFATTVNTIQITPTDCAVPGQVTVKGIITDLCGSAAPSSTAVWSKSSSNYWPGARLYRCSSV